MLLASSPAGRAQARAAGIRRAITKPVRRAHLLQIVADTLHSDHTTTAAELAPSPEAATPKEPPPARAALRVLVVDDNPVNQLVAKGLLARRGATVDTADDGHQALERLSATHPYALVLMDCQMPRLDGYAATRRRDLFASALCRPVVDR